MKKILTALLLVIPAAALTAVCLAGYSSEKYQYSVLVPTGWQRSETDFGYKHVIYFTSGTTAEVKVTSESGGKEEMDKWNRIEDWYFEDGTIKKRIIHRAGRLSSKDPFSSMVAVFETGRGGGTGIKKVSVRKNGSKIVAVECGATLSRYYALTDTFDEIISSVNFKAE